MNEAVPGQQLTGNVGLWTNGVLGYAYQLTRNGIVFQSGNWSSGPLYTVQPSDVGNTIAILVAATNRSGTGPIVSSAPIVIVNIVLPVNITLPTISGIAQVGQMLTAHSLLTDWTNSPTSLDYQWNKGGVPIVGATSSTYVPVSGDVGDFLTVSVTAINGFGLSTPATSAATIAVIDIIPTINTAPSIPGIPQATVPISAIDAIWNNSVVSKTYQWKAAGVNATGAGATTLTYTPVIGDVANTLTITVIATNTGGTSSPSTSAASAPVIATPSGPLKIDLGIDIGSIPVGA